MRLILILGVLSMMNPIHSQAIYDFKKEGALTNWYVVNDGVMGGLSQGSMTINAAGNGLFKGYVTTENNGGFSSVRCALRPLDVSKYSHIVVKLKGDGKAYQFRLKEDRYQRYSYIQQFQTSGEWEEIKLPLADFYPGFRGYRLDKPNFSGKKLAEIAFLIGNKTKEEFGLEIEAIYLE